MFISYNPKVVLSQGLCPAFRPLHVLPYSRSPEYVTFCSVSPHPLLGSVAGWPLLPGQLGSVMSVSPKLPARNYIFMGRGRLNRPIVLPVCNSCSCCFCFSPLIPILAPTQPRRLASLASRCCDQSLYWPTALQWASGRRSLLW